MGRARRSPRFGGNAWRRPLLSWRNLGSVRVRSLRDLRDWIRSAGLWVSGRRGLSVAAKHTDEHAAKLARSLSRGWGRVGRGSIAPGHRGRVRRCIDRRRRGHRWRRRHRLCFGHGRRRLNRLRPWRFAAFGWCGGSFRSWAGLRGLDLRWTHRSFFLGPRGDLGPCRSVALEFRWLNCQEGIDELAARRAALAIVVDQGVTIRADLRHRSSPIR